MRTGDIWFVSAVIFYKTINNKGEVMFGLPAATAFLVFGIPLLWVIYTIGFWVASRGWEQGGGGDDQA